MAQGIWEMSILYPKTSKEFHHDIKFWKGIRKRCTIKKLFLKILQYSLTQVFSVNNAKFLRPPILKKICKRLFERFSTRKNNATSNIESEEVILSKAKEKEKKKEKENS